MATATTTADARHRGALDGLNPQQAQFVEALVANGGNASAAAREVGYTEDHGRRLVSQNATIKRALNRVRQEAEEGTRAELRPWAELAPLAQDVLERQMTATPEEIVGDYGDPTKWATVEGVRGKAAREVLDRALGKPTQSVDQTVTHTDERAGPDATTMRVVLNLIAHNGWTFAQAMAWTESHPEDVRAWLQGQKALPAGPGRELGPADGPGPETIEAEVVAGS